MCGQGCISSLAEGVTAHTPGSRAASSSPETPRAGLYGKEGFGGLRPAQTVFAELVLSV